MMNNNKILTVSYGTFSCTLEGFDDSFETMKAIAEYFRDLASDDRYFGAEPPQPDAEMLARIAEREMARRVEAREHDGRIMLKAHNDAAAPAPAPASSPGAVVIPAAVPPMGVSIPKAAPETPVEAFETEAPLETSDVKKHLPDQKIAARDAPAEKRVAAKPEPVETREDVVGTTPDVDIETAQEPQPQDETEVPVTEDITAAAPDGAEENIEITPAAHTARNDFAKEVATQDTAQSAQAFFADSPAYEEIETDADDDTAQAPERFEALTDFSAPAAVRETTTDSIADKLQRIRDVVSQQNARPVAAAYDEDEATGEADTAIGFLDTPFDVAAQQVGDIKPDDGVPASTPGTATPQIEEALETDDQIATQAQTQTDIEDDDLSNILRQIEADADQGEKKISNDLQSLEDDDAVPEADEGNLFDAGTLQDDPDPARERAETGDVPEGGPDKTGEVHARVLKVNRVDLEAALEAGELEEFGGAENATLSAPENAGLPRLDAGGSEDLSRLMAEADQQMKEPEGATRRSAFAHLRAAVAARFADKSMDPPKTDEETTKAYRSDLAEVVRPRRPIASGNRTERPTESRTAPLKLVAEQRVDTAALRDAGPVTPRRVAATLEGDMDFAEDTGFAAFAHEAGATELPELLEAAAAYLCFVEGHEQFSRPQLMTRVRQAECGEFTREDGLRSFGQLLRSGKIEKIKGGLFAASDTIGFRPDTRAAG